MHCLITGGSGYFGSVLKQKLLQRQYPCVNLDLLADRDQHPQLSSYVIDITNKTAIEKIFLTHPSFDTVFHCAAQLELKRNNKDFFDKTNRDSTRYLADLSVQHGVKNFVFISSNCVYGKVNSLSVQETQPLHPFEHYGVCKTASENILGEYTNKLNVIILRPPTIIGEGRLGILSVVYDFIREHKIIWLVGSGHNRYQFIYGGDLAEACFLAANLDHSAIYNIGSDHVPSLKQLFTDVIQHANSQSNIKCLPRSLALPILRATHYLGLSPLGPYNYSMLSSSYISDTSKIKAEIGWRPTKTNSQMLIDGYDYYMKHYNTIHDKNNRLPGHRKAGWGGVLNVVKWFS